MICFLSVLCVYFLIVGGGNICLRADRKDLEMME